MYRWNHRWLNSYFKSICLLGTWPNQRWQVQRSPLLFRVYHHSVFSDPAIFPTEPCLTLRILSRQPIGIRAGKTNTYLPTLILLLLSSHIIPNIFGIYDKSTIWKLLCIQERPIIYKKHEIAATESLIPSYLL